MAKIFINYRRADSQTIADRIHDYLVRKLGDRNVFKDVHDIKPGDDFRAAIEKAIISTDIVLMVIGRHWVNIADSSANRRLDNPNDWVRIELEMAVRHEKRIIPVLVDGVTMPSADELPASISQLAFRNASLVRNDPDFTSDMDRLINRLNKPGLFKRWVLGIAAVLAIIILAMIFIPTIFQSLIASDTTTTQVAAIPTTTTNEPSPITLFVFETSTSTSPLTESPSPTITILPAIAPTDIPTNTPTATPSNTPTDTETPTRTPSFTIAPTFTYTPTEAVISLEGIDNTLASIPRSLDDIRGSTRIADWQAAGFTGAEQRIGVIDYGFGGINALLANADMNWQNGQVSVYGNDLNRYDEQSLRQGTEVLRVIHTIAPGTTLYACSYTDFSQFENCVTWMVERQVRIINHSGSIPTMPMSSVDAWVQEAEYVTNELPPAQQILWINAVGNFGESLIEDQFYDFDGNNLHEFQISRIPYETLDFGPNQQSTGTIILTWEANTIDLDLIVEDYLGNSLITNHRQQGNANDQAIEWGNIPLTQGFRVQIRNASGQPTNVKFQLAVDFYALDETLVPDLLSSQNNVIG